MILKVRRVRRPRSGRLPFLGLGFGAKETVVVVACTVWESGKPVFGFPLFHAVHAWAVGMWKSRGVCEISKGLWEEWETWVWFSTLSTAPAFPQPRLPCQRKRGGGIGDSLLQARNSLALAALIFLALSVSLMARANGSSRWKPMPSLR